MPVKTTSVAYITDMFTHSITNSSNSSTSIYNKSLVNSTSPGPSGSDVKDNVDLAVGLSVTLVLLTALVVILFILYRKGKFKPLEMVASVGEFFQNMKQGNSSKGEDKPGIGLWRGRRRSDKMAICQNEVSQNPSGTNLADNENAFCQSIEEDHGTNISYTLSEDTTYDALNDSASRRVATKQAYANYEHVNRLPPDLEGDYDSADANALFPKRGTHERPDSYNPYSHLTENERAGKMSEKSDDKVTYINKKNIDSDVIDQKECIPKHPDSSEQQIDENSTEECRDESVVDENDDMIDDSYDDGEIYDTAVAEIIQQRSNRETDPEQ